MSEMQISPDKDFQKALEFYNLTEMGFGDQLPKLSMSFPQKYDGKADFLAEFEELDEVERRVWCDHQLKETHSLYNKKDGQDSARKNIWWVLMVCSEFKIELSRQYHLLRMIKVLWLRDLSARTEVKQKLKEIFDAMGEFGEVEVDKSKLRTTFNEPPRKKQNSCGCLNGGCLIF